MNGQLGALAAGLLAFAATVADTVVTSRFAGRVALAAVPAPAAPAGPDIAPQDDDLQALRRQINQLNNELLGLQFGPITSKEQLRKVVGDHMVMRDRREKVHKFSTRAHEVHLLAREWSKVAIQAYGLDKPEAEKATAVLNGLADELEKLSKTTGGEPELEGQISALFDQADKDLLALVPEQFKTRYRPIPRGWTSGLVANVGEEPK